MPGLVRLVPAIRNSELNELQNPLGLTGPDCGSEATGGWVMRGQEREWLGPPWSPCPWKQQHGVITPTARGLCEVFMPNRIR